MSFWKMSIMLKKTVKEEYMILELNDTQEGIRKGIEVRILELRLKGKQVEKPTIVWASI